MHAAVVGVLLDGLADGFEAATHVTSYVDRDPRKVVPSRVVPERELADAAESVDPERFAIEYRCNLICSCGRFLALSKHETG